MNRLYKNEGLDRVLAITRQLNAYLSVLWASLLALFLLCVGLCNTAAAALEPGAMKVGGFGYSEWAGLADDEAHGR